jgi:HSP20 family protein
MKNINTFVNRGILDELFRDVNPGYFIKPLHGDPLPAQIKVDVKENTNEFIVHAEIPGADKKNIQVDIDHDVVNIRAHISQLDSDTEDDKPLRSERYYGEVSRGFQLSTEIDEPASKARYENGVLTLTLVKKQKKGGHRIAID